MAATTRSMLTTNLRGITTKKAAAATASRRFALGSIPQTTCAFSRRPYSSVFGYTMAKCLVFTEHGEPEKVLKFQSHSIPPAYGDEVTVKFLAAPVNPADINQIEGVYPSKPKFSTTLGTPTPCAVPGNEGVVEVVSCGSKVGEELKPGDWAVMSASAFGTWRTYASAKPSDLLKITNREGITPVQAATVSVNPCTAYRMLKDFAELKPGDWFIQNGANSAVGRYAIQFGREWGLKSINIIRDRPEIAELRSELEGLGATLVMTEEEMSQKEAKGNIADACGRGSLPKLALNCVGGSSATNMVKDLAEGAHLVTYGAMSKKPLSFAAGPFIFKDLHAHGFWISAWAKTNPEAKRQMLDEIFDMIRSGKLKEPSTHICEWTDDTKLPELLEAVGKGISGYAGKKTIFVMKDT